MLSKMMKMWPKNGYVNLLSLIFKINGVPNVEVIQSSTLFHSLFLSLFLSFFVVFIDGISEYY
ncbi:hypothetical protein H5410_025987 [Solanum commersonii]|uniref:Uncharacterized protein n=1 Tax=Solanum commersonii TaxID=4109 RepID=A0A9J5YXM2_SOLCO|nr:hypothetical protein H5410_025987 [Solanum commersonii]